MNKTLKNILLKDILIGIIIVVGGSLILRLIDCFLSLNLFSIVFSRVWIWLNFKILIPVWLIIIIGIIVFFILRLYHTFISSSRKEAQVPEWLFYRMDEFDGRLFTWEYERNVGDKIEITDLRQICKKCHCGLVESFFIGNTNVTDDENTAAYKELTYGLNRELKLQCPNCKSVYETVSDFELRKIEELIKHRVDTKKYKESPYFENTIQKIG